MKWHKMSRLTSNRLRSAFEVHEKGEIVEVPCDRCAASGRLCVAMPNWKSPRCSECIRSGKTCANMTWASLDKTRAEYRKKVDEDEKIVAEAMARLLRNKKILKQADEKAARKTEHLVAEMEASGELEMEGECPAPAALVAWSPAVWDALGFVNSAVGVAPSGDIAGDVPLPGSEILGHDPAVQTSVAPS